MTKVSNLQVGPGQIEVRALKGDPVIHLGATEVGFFLLPSESARAIAGDLLMAADIAEGKDPSHIYQVDCRE